MPSELCEIVKHLPETIKCTFHQLPYHIFYDCFQDLLICLVLSPLIYSFLIHPFKFWKYALIKILPFSGTSPNFHELLHF